MHATGVHFLLVRFIVFIKNALKENTMNLESQDKKEFVIDTKVTLQTEGTMQGQLVECGGEFVLPDYMPVIQKVLRLEAKVLMPSRYVGANNVQMSGDVLHTLIYLGEDGETGATVLPSKYEFSVKSDECAPHGITAKVEVEGLNYRITAPRKLNIRTRLNAKPYCTHGMDITPEILPTDAEINTLYSVCNSIKTTFLNSTDAEISDSINIGNKDARLIWCGATAGVTDAKVIDGGVSVRGEVLAKVLTEGDGAIKMHTKKIPFDEFLEGDVRRADAATANVCVVSTEAAKESGEVSLDISLYIEATVDSPVKIPMLKDAFSTEYESKNEYKKIKVLNHVKSLSGIYTTGASISKNALSNSDIGTVVDTSGRAVLRELTFANGSLNANGVCELSSVLESENEYTSASYSVPFCVSLDCDTVDNAKINASCELVNARVRVEGDNLVCDMDIAFSARVLSQSEEDALITIDCSTKDKHIKTACPLSIVYPNGESLWNIAKKYHVSPQSLAKVNSIEVNESDYSKKEILSDINLLMLELK